VSAMIAELVKAGYIIVRPDPTHGRRRLISLTPTGVEHVQKGSHLLDAKLSETVARSGVDEQEYLKLTLTLYETIAQSGKANNEHSNF
jgi:DNA-binding MarR family transcriptional regulator